MTSTGRPDYDQTVKLSTLAPGEPIFIIRASDAVAGDAIRAWAALAHHAGTPPEALELALQQADAMDQWKPKKAPDGPDLDDNRRKQLVYEFSRRAWNRNKRPPTPDMALGHQLGQDAVLGRLRPILGDLLPQLKPEVVQTAHAPLRALYALVGQALDQRLRDKKPS